MDIRIGRHGIVEIEPIGWLPRIYSFQPFDHVSVIRELIILFMLGIDFFTFNDNIKNPAASRINSESIPSFSLISAAN